MPVKIAVVATKGGAGKTTLAANLGALLADLGVSVLLVDADVQPTLSSFFPIRHEAPHGLSKLVQTGKLTSDVVSETSIENLDIVRSDDPDGKLASWVSEQGYRWLNLRRALEGVEDEAYQCIIVDTQGAVGPLAEAASLTADRLLSPLPPETPSTREFLRGTVDMLNRLDGWRTSTGIRIAPMDVVIYRQARTRDARAIADDIRSKFFETGGRISVLDTVVPAAKAYTEAATLQTPVHRHEPRRNGQMLAAGQVMHELVWELFPALKVYDGNGGAA